MGDADKLFDELFDNGQSNVLRLDRKQSSAAQAAAAQESPQQESTPGIEREWYLVEDGVQVGPLIRAELEERWAARDIDHNTLVWKQGMPDWATISDTPELLYLITRRPQTTPHLVQPDTPSAPAATSTGLPATFESPSAPAATRPATIELTNEVAGAVHDTAAAPQASQPADAAVTWRPSAATELASLVETEMGDPAPSKPTSQPAPAQPTQPAGLGVDLFSPNAPSLPTFGQDAGLQREPFFPGTVGPAPHMSGGLGGGMSPAPFGGGSFGQFPGAGWSVPAPLPAPASSGIKPVHLLLGVVLVAVLVIVAVVLGALVMRDRPQLVASHEAAPPQAQAKAAPVAAPEASAAAPAEAKPAEAPAETKPAQTQAEPKPQAEAPKPAAPKPAAHTPPPPRPAPKPEPRREASPGKEKLALEDILAGVKKGQGAVRPCLERAQRGRELLPGSYRIILDWMIRPDGSVTGAKVKGPASVLSSSLPACFELQMRKWKFPPSAKGAPVRNFPFGPVTIH